MPAWLDTLIDAISPYLPAIGIGGLVMMLASMVVIPFLIVKMPADYFVRERHQRHWTVWTVIWWLLRNLLALVLFVAGFLMLFLPGQGLLTILIALVVSDFPGKYRLERAVIGQSSVLKAVNWVRRKYNKTELRCPS
ncbi:hypothetical protein [Gallaecimonas pentaromativorans]|uniref:Uncharacterized protein n=1 Tax=Gallaecimonas pentaromativorans TaxID=584787 RepID=A0A3N1PV53_9GAMM|nr:hypothetical protein [Gallaecimonas pentaromativorans]MED5523445.1 hypothetical protein [Pseudomonadota bacterium]ROQ30630.1 hypothetical protein EDC28_101316 [Gallaecimonas pentaromativorans]